MGQDMMVARVVRGSMEKMAGLGISFLGETALIMDVLYF